MAMGEKIRVIIVDDIAETRENIRKLLQFESDFEVIGAARTGKEGIQLAIESKPDVILMDINMPDMDGITATENIRRDLPFAQVVILSVQGDPNYMRRAMMAGARDFLTKPPTADELTSAIRRAGRMAVDEKVKNTQYFGTGTTTLLNGNNAQAMRYGKVFVVYSPKGGAGCTTVATNLAMALQTKETPVALVDGNLQFGDVAVFLNVQSKNSIIDLASRSDELDLEIVNEVMVSHAASGVKVLAAPPRPEYSENVSGQDFSKVIQFLRKVFAYVIIDTESSLSDITLAAIDEADLVLLLTTQEIPAIKNARLFLNLLDVMKVERGRVIFTINKHDKRIPITTEKIAESLKQPVSNTIMFDDKVVVSSINRGLPFYLEDKTKPLARDFLELADSLREKFNTMEPVLEPVTTGKLGKR